MSKKSMPAVDPGEPDADDFPPGESGENGEPMPHEVDSAVDTMMKAEQHKQNPLMMKAVQRRLTGKKKAINSIQDLKDRKAQLMGEPDGN